MYKKASEEPATLFGETEDRDRGGAVQAQRVGGSKEPQKGPSGGGGKETVYGKLRASPCPPHTDDAVRKEQ